MTRTVTAIGLLAALGMTCVGSISASAAGRYISHGVREGRSVAVSGQPGVSFERRARRGGSALVSDGPGTGFGFHSLPEPYRFGAAIARDRQADAVHAAVINSAIGNIYQGYPGSSVYQYGNRADYGVFSGGDSYGTPYFAGWYGPGDGEDLGPLGTTYR